GYTTMLLWHGGLSGSAPLSMTTVSGAAKVVDESLIHRLGGDAALQPSSTLIGLEQTIGSGLNFFITGGLLIGVPVLVMLLAPRRREEMQTIARFDVSMREQDEHAGDGNSLPDRLERSPIVV